ncbi:Predicted transcriptional regulator [Pasteurella testudinis DSM 23072]|uniref:Predicted transcriptional regulator n=1 Tax=Pasteurella testudinis DSM 23072 TaxID=1122938 RepID=A0A1W1UN06_9PAST|nr:DNA-binding protein [Pasteurella testudinis]SMB82467.1 Predicted transcriptional regulator [Pasteurella testudinis DSM 23072]SUB52198.1 putative bacteriophage transcriptional regulator [Pasteurella testudinis]
MPINKEWFLAKDLAGIAGLPQLATNVTRKAKIENWKKRKSSKGIQGGAFEYHYSSLPFKTQIFLGFSIADDTATQDRNFTYIECISPEQQTSAKNYAFRTDWIEKNRLTIVVQNDRLKMFKMPDDGMEKTIYNGDIVLLSIFQYQSVYGLKCIEGLKDGLYLVNINSQQTIRRLQFDVQGGIFINCDNLLYNSLYLAPEKITTELIQGKVEWYAHTMKWE